MKMISSGNSIVDEIGKIPFTGNVLPHNWFNVLKLENGKADTIAIIILAEIVYWYRPSEIKDEKTGMFLGYKKRFKADLLQKKYDGLAEQFGLTKRQVKDACKRLEDYGLIKRHFRTVQANNTKLGNVLFIELNPEKIKEITLFNLPYDEKASEGYDVKTSEGVGGYDVKTSEGMTLKRQTNTESTYTEITNTKITNNICSKSISYDSLFEEFWKAYPKKVSKEPAYNAFKKRMKEKKYSFETIMDGLEKYKAELKAKGTSRQYILNPSSFLNGARFTDEYDETEVSTKNSSNFNMEDFY